MSDSVSRWDEASAEDIPTTEFDKVIAEMQLEWSEVERIDEMKKAARAKYDACEAKLLDMLQRAKKTKYQAEGVGTASIKNRYITRVPKTAQEKQALFTWIRMTHGPEALLGLTSINSQTLNAFVNEEREKNPLVEIPGLEAPIHEVSIVFRGERKK